MASAKLRISLELLELEPQLWKHFPEGVTSVVEVKPDWPDDGYCKVFIITHPDIPEGTQEVTPQFSRKTDHYGNERVQFEGWNPRQ